MQATFQPTNQSLFHPSSFYATFTPSSTSLFHWCHLTRNRQFTLSIIWFIQWSRPCSYHRTNLDPVPTNVLKKLSNALSPTIFSIIYLFITTGTFPSTLKSSIISLLFKKHHLNQVGLSNYRPIANLSFVSKLTEKIIKKSSWPFNL